MSASQNPSLGHVNVSRRLALAGTGVAAAALVVAGARSALADESEALELDVSALGFLYLDSPELVLGQTQHVAVSLAELGVTEEAELSVAAPDGSTLAVAPASLTSSSYLFSFVPDALGAHTVLGLVFVASDGVRRSLDLASCAGDASLFDVVAESAQDATADVEDAADAVDEFSTTEAYALDDADELVSADTVEECIEEHVDAEEVASSLDEASDEAASATEAGTARAAAGTATIRAAVRTTGAAATTRVASDSSSSSSLVVALDPGHGGTDSGTYFTYDGTTVYERDLTWAIANACMDELSSYSGLSLVLTRDEDEYVSISDRVTRAAEAGASLIVSFHINSTSNTTSTTANGAEVFVPYDGTYNNETHEIGATLAEYILEELTELGLNSRGLKYKIIEDDDSYDYADGSCGDYYGILRYARQLAITGILIEHAFLNNASDYENYLSTDEKLAALGQADARGIVAGLQSLGLLDGSTTSQGYVTIYRLYNKSTGEHLYTRSTTERTKCLKAGWVSENIGWYAPTSGTEVRRLYNPNTGDHLYSTSPTEPAKLVAVGWVDEDVCLYSAEGGDGTVEVYRLYNPNATVGTHLLTTSSTEVTKCVAAGWTYEGVVLRGVVAEGWCVVDGGYYYYEYGDDGALAPRTGWLTTSDNPLSTSTSSHSYWLAADTGKLAVSRLVTESEVGYWAFATKYGWMATGKYTDSTTGYVYLADSSGELEDPGWLVTSDYDGELQRYYVDSTYHACIPGYSTDGYAHYTTSSGYVLRNDWVKVNGTWYYADNDGLLEEGDPTEAAMISKAQSYSSSTGYLILVDSTTNKTAIFTGSKGSWSISKYWDCCTGASSSPTPKGTYTIGSRGYSFGSGYTCYYWTQFYGSCLFHSILYNQGTLTVQDGTMGANVSHGCVRLLIENAKYIYDTIPKGTTVVSYAS